MSPLSSTQLQNRYLFNFAASYSTGGYKRLYEYANWFNRNGGAWFVIHPRCTHLVAEFPNNRFFIAKQSRIERLYNDCAYLKAIEQEIGQPELYYSYGIPLYFRFGKVSWFHLSNVLPLRQKAIPLNLFARLKFAFLGMKIRSGFAYADIISAESASSLKMLGLESPDRLFLSVNGSDDELAWLQSKGVTPKEDIATVVGTVSYKALDDSFRLFEFLRKGDARLKLIIIGNPKWIPHGLTRKQNVVIRGLQPRSTVVDWLRKTKIYISTTRIENSYNAAAEGIFFADESYISDIGPHRELLVGMPFEQVSVLGVRTPLLHVHRDRLTGANLKNWETVVVEMIARFHETLRSKERS
jgi:hypothetical protein